ncbi:MAG: heterodisulfide reductase subunit C [Cryomorphaceae bacterium]|jgi:heterodisulfide reductase subunit C
MGISNIVFLVVLIAAGGAFAFQVSKIRRNILLGRDVDRSDRKPERLAMMARVALGQSKMVTRPLAGMMHVIIYVGFVVINIEVLEIMIDGVFGTHRIFSFLGGFYDLLIGSFEILAFLVLFACVVFLVRRNIGNIKRFKSIEMTSWPKNDANIILAVEVLLMFAFLSMNATDYLLQLRGVEHYVVAGAYPVSSLIAPWFDSMSTEGLIMYERGAWWFHIVGILLFLNYLPISKHFHIILAFPNVFYAKLDDAGKFSNMDKVTDEVKLMMDPTADPYATPPPADPDAVPEKFGAKDVQDLHWKNLMDAYSCTECGRCTSACPANMTGKLLSPRKIMMDTRDRLEEVGRNIDKHGKDYDDGKSLLGDYIKEEELWACTTCNACVDECPVNINPLEIIVDLRRYLVMEESKSPTELNGMFTNVENNGAPWAFPQADRLKWAEEL